jgi:hypothetical protein
MSLCCGSCKFGTFSNFEDLGSEFGYSYFINLEENRKKLEEFDKERPLYAFVQVFGVDRVSTVLKNCEQMASKENVTTACNYCEHCRRCTWWYVDRGGGIQMALMCFFQAFVYWKKFEDCMKLL